MKLFLASIALIPFQTLPGSLCGWQQKDLHNYPICWRRHLFSSLQLGHQKPSQSSGFRTHYLWEDIWQPDTLLELLQNYLCIENKSEKVYEHGKLVEKEKELLDAVKLDSLRVERISEGSIALIRQNATLEGIGDGSGSIPQTPEKDTLANIVDRLNQTYGANLTKDDKIDLERIRHEVEQNPDLQAVMAANNTEQTKREKFSEIVDKILLKFIHTKLDLYRKIKAPEVEEFIKREWFEQFRDQDAG